MDRTRIIFSLLLFLLPAAGRQDAQGTGAEIPRNPTTCRKSDMNHPKKINVPLIEGLEDMTTEAFDLAMEKGGSKAAVAEVGWPEEFPYMPDCSVRIARSRTHLAVSFHVRGLDLRALEMEDNGRSWEDSCCEFFVAHPTDGTYYNFELTCIGSLLCAKRHGRHDPSPIPPEELRRVIRHHSLPREPLDIRGGIHEWTTGMVIPMDLIGIDPGRLPASLRGNFYKCGDLTATPHFVTWNRITTEKPDFHRPEYFGELILR